MATDYMDGPDDAPVANHKIKLPKKAYKLRCVECDFSRSKEKTDPKTGLKAGNNPMYVRKWEVVEPATVKIRSAEKSAAEGKDVFDEVTIAGLTVMDWLTLTPKTKNIVKADCNRLGVEPPDDNGASVTQYINKEAYAILFTKVTSSIDEETREPILLPSGEPRIDYQHQIPNDGWLG